MSNWNSKEISRFGNTEVEISAKIIGKGSE